MKNLNWNSLSNAGNQRRRELFHQYQSYCDDLKTICGNISLKQWVNGSFTTKSKDPADIDLVTFIDAEIAKKNEAALKGFVYPKSMVNYQMDAYIIIIYPEDSKMHFVTNADRLYWMDHFGKTKPNKYRKRVLKGFLEIIV